MERPDYIPENYNRIKVVESLTALANACFGKKTPENCFLLPRQMKGDFDGLGQALAKRSRIKDGDFYSLGLRQIKNALTLPLQEDQKLALKQIFDDMVSIEETFQGRAHSIHLRVVRGYAHSSATRFHTDGGNRLLCGYSLPVTECAKNEDVIYTGYDNKYLLKANAQPFSFAPGDMWLQEGGRFPDKKPRNEEDPQHFIHRATEPAPGNVRLLLICETKAPSLS